MLTKISDVATTDTVHASLEKRKLLPDEHLVNGSYIRSTTILRSLQKYNVKLIGPVKPNPHWQAEDNGYDLTQFNIDWDSKVVTCPEDKKSISWWEIKGAAGEDRLRIKWSRTNCRVCPTEYRCKRSRTQAKILNVAQREQHELIQKVRAKQNSKPWKELYNLRASRRRSHKVFALLECEGAVAAGLRKLTYR